MITLHGPVDNGMWDWIFHDRSMKFWHVRYELHFDHQTRSFSANRFRRHKTGGSKKIKPATPEELKMLVGLLPVSEHASLMRAALHSDPRYSRSIDRLIAP